METSEEIKKACDQFWIYASHSSAEELKLPSLLCDAILKIGPTNFIAYNFNNYNGASAMGRCFLLIFQFWQDFTFRDWQDVFNKVHDKNSGQYYLNYNFKTLLGIDPGFARYTQEFPSAISFPDYKMISGVAVFELDGPMRKHYKEYLIKYGITLEMLENISDNLIKEGARSIRGNGTIEQLDA